MSTKGQVSVEYLIVTGFLLLVVGVMASLSIVLFNENSAIAKSTNLVSTITKNADLCASMGNGSAIIFEADVPPNLESFQLINHTVNLRISTASGTADVYDYTSVNLTPVTLEHSQGKKLYKAEYLDGNVTVSKVE